MGKELRYVTITFLLLLSVVCSAQTSEDIWIEKDTTATKHEVVVKEKVCMTPTTFTYYHEVDKNLKAIEDSIPVLAKNIEDERAAADSVEANLRKQVYYSNLQKTVAVESLDDCIDTAVELEITNLHLEKALEKEKKNNWKYAAGGAALVGIIRLGVNLIFGR